MSSILKLFPFHFDSLWRFVLFGPISRTRIDGSLHFEFSSFPFLCHLLLLLPKVRSPEPGLCRYGARFVMSVQSTTGNTVCVRTPEIYTPPLPFSSASSFAAYFFLFTFVGIQLEFEFHGRAVAASSLLSFFFVVSM